MGSPELPLDVENPPEEKSDANLLVENSSKEKISVSSQESTAVENSSMKKHHKSSKREKSAMKDDEHEHESSNIWSWTAEEETHNNGRESFHQKWKKLFVASCLLAVLVDPLFLYVPLVNDDLKCVMLDWKLKIAVLILRSVTDIFYIFDIVTEVYGSQNFSDLIDKFRGGSHFRSKLNFLWRSFAPIKAKTIFWGSYGVLIDILAILPLPQVAILVLVSRMRDLRMVVIVNLFVLSQYVPRVLRIYLLCKELRRSPKEETKETAIWVKGALNFAMYIIVSHVFGALWYFFAVQRVTVCWHFACGKGKRCGSYSTFGCHDLSASRNVTLLNDYCPINPPNATLFDFGIFTGVLQSGIAAASTNYFQKFSNCFGWGFRNLSSLGSNLQPSIDGWENLFATFISVVGLLLFLYLIGNLQMYMQFETARREDHRHKMVMSQRMEKIRREIDLWLFKKGIPTRLHKDMKLQIMEKVQAALVENIDVNLDDILSLLPSGLQSKIKSCMPLTRLEQVPILEEMDEPVLKAIFEHLKPMKYSNSEIIFQEGQPLNIMIFIVDGLVNIEKQDCSWQIGAGELCGENLVEWPLLASFPSVLPLATESAKAIGDVEALGLSAKDMESVSSKFRTRFLLIAGERENSTRWDASGRFDGLLWYKDLGQHVNGDFSMAVIQANSLMEDQSQVESGPFSSLESGPHGTFVGVYDGHGGPETSRFLNEHLFKNIKKFTSENQGMSADVINKAFLATEEEFLSLVKKQWVIKPLIASVGSCCLVGVVCSGLLYIANVGGSRAVLGKLNKTIEKVEATQVSTEHNASYESVREELRSLHPDDPQIVLLKHNVWRVKGLIQVSRSIGDAYLKSQEFNKEPLREKFRLSEPFNKPILKAEPTILVQKLYPEDQFLIFASDGLWEQLSNQEAADIVQKYPRNGIARKLVKFALREAAKKREMTYSELSRIDRGVRRHFHDDITVVVLFLSSNLVSRSYIHGPLLSVKAGGGVPAST